MAVSLRILPIVACVGLLAACGSQAEKDNASGGETLDVSTSNADSTFKISSKEGSMTVHEGDDLAVSLPKGFSMPAGAKVTAVQNMSAGGKDGALMVYFKAKDSPKQIVDHFRKQAEAVGITIGMEMKTPTGMTASSTDEKSRRFMITADNEKGKTSGTLMIGG